MYRLADEFQVVSAVVTGRCSSVLLAAMAACSAVARGGIRCRSSPIQNNVARSDGAMLCASLMLAAALWVGVSLTAATGSTDSLIDAGAAEVAHSGMSELIEVPPSSDGKKFSFKLDDLAGTQHDLSHAPGSAVLVHFFATWCEPCRKELPALQRLMERSGNSALAIFAISVGEPDDRVRRFFDKWHLTFPILLDRDREAAKTWRVRSLPTTYLLDRDLDPRLVAEGEFEWDRVESEQLLQVLSMRQDNGMRK